MFFIFEDFGGDFGGENVQLEYGLDCFVLFPFTISTSSATQKTSKPLAEADAKSMTLNSTCGTVSSMYGLEGTVSMTNSPYLLYLVARFFERLLWFMSVGNGGQIPCPNQTMVREKDAFCGYNYPEN